MKQEITITAPTKWSAVSLEKYLKMRKDMETYKDNDEAIYAVLFYHLCGVDAQTINKLDIGTYTAIQNDLASFMQKTEYPLQQFIKVDGKEYGFEPNLSQMAYGAYVDLGKYENLTIDDKWHEVMSILYRPVKRKIGASYEIETYNGVINPDIFLNVDMEVHFGALGFFINLLQDCQKGILKYLRETGEIPANILTILEKSGKLTLPFTPFQAETY
jgi:hypothetical protein